MDRQSAAMHLDRTLSQAPVELLESQRARIERLRSVSDATRSRIDRRLGFAGRPAEWLWNELRDYSDVADELMYVDKVDVRYSDDLIEALGRRARAGDVVPDNESLNELLAMPEDETGWLGVFLVQLAGERRTREALPTLVERLGTDDDITPSMARDAIVRIGDAAVLQPLHDRAVSESTSFRWFAAETICRFRVPESEDILLAMLAEEDDFDLRTMLAAYLCELFSARGVEPVCDVIREGYSGFLISLPESLLPVLDVLERNVPGALEWRREREESAAARLERAEEFAELARLYDERERTANGSWGDRGPSSLDGLPVEPIVRTEVKVGRNEPCPCGSGRKYKKCCGK